MCEIYLVGHFPLWSSSLMGGIWFLWLNKAIKHVTGEGSATNWPEQLLSSGWNLLMCVSTNPDFFQTFPIRSCKKLLRLDKELKHVMKNLTFYRHAKCPIIRTRSPSKVVDMFLNRDLSQGQLSENNFQLLGTQPKLPLLLKTFYHLWMR